MDKPTTTTTTTTQRHILFDLTPLDMVNEEIEEKTQRCYQNLKRMINNKSPKERQEIYSKHIAANPQVHTEELTIGLLVTMLHDHGYQGQEHDYYQDVVTMSKDNLTLFSNYLNMIIIERVTRLNSFAVRQIFAITHQLMNAGATSAETTCSNLIRQTAKSDLTPRNIFMAEHLIDLLSDNRTWLINSTQFMVPTVIFNLMRLIMDHMGPAHKALRRKETEFVIGLIREKFDCVIQIGRDFLRMLHYLTRIPEFQVLQQDIYSNNPRQLNPKYEGAQQLLATRTPRRLFQSCLTFDMERKISFLATQVKFGNQRRYQEWFAKQYFANGTESTMLRCDLIRYICTIIHPSNEVLCSDIIPRWAIIGWLLTTANHVVTNCRLALLFDWFAYDAKTDNIMNIEPGILIMCHSVRSHPQVTASLLEFLCRAPALFPPKVSEQIKLGIKKSLQQILEKRVLQSLTPVFFHPKFDPQLKALIRETFPEYCQADNGTSHPNVPPHHQPQQQQQQPTVIATPPRSVTPPKATIAPSPIPTPVITQSTVKVLQDQVARSDSTSDISDNSRLPEAMVVDDNTSVIQSFDASPKTMAKSQDQKTNHQDINHNARALANSSSISTTQTKVVKKQRPSVTVPSGDSSDSELRSWEKASGLDLDEIFSKKSHLLESMGDDDSPGIGLGNPFSNYSDNFFSNLSHHNVYPTHIEDRNAESKVIYPFMEVNYSADRCQLDSIKSFDEPTCNIVEEFINESSIETRCSLMNKLISTLQEMDEKSLNEELFRNIASHLARPIADDFMTRIFPSNSQDVQSLEQSIASPFFVLCSRTNLGVPDSKLEISVPVNILIWLVSHLRLTLPLLIYYMRVRYVIQAATPGTQSKPVSAQHYESFVEACRLKPEDTLFVDLDCLYIYDAKMFCFLLPSLYHEYATHHSITKEDTQSNLWQITNNHKLIHKVVAAIDPASLQDLLCFCLHGTCKVISRDNPLEAIEPSLKWESWEQYCFWKIVSSQSVPIENFIEILPQLDAKAHPEALSSIMLILQRLEEPHTDIIDHVVMAYSKSNEHFVTSLIRHWAIKTDVQDLASNLVSLFSKRSSNQVKRKGQTKTTSKAATSLTTKDEKLLSILEYIRLKAPRNKLLAQKELHDGLTEIETICDDGQRTQFSALFTLRTKPTKKKKLDKDN